MSCVQNVLLFRNLPKTFQNSWFVICSGLFLWRIVVQAWCKKGSVCTCVTLFLCIKHDKWSMFYQDCIPFVQCLQTFYIHICGLARLGPPKKYKHWDLSEYLIAIVWHVFLVIGTSYICHRAICRPIFDFHYVNKRHLSLLYNCMHNVKVYINLLSPAVTDVEGYN